MAAPDLTRGHVFQHPQERVMTSQKKPAPLAGAPPLREACPVCGMPTYSRAGIHPQCAQRQADAPRMARLKLAQWQSSACAAESDPVAFSTWQKCCPECRVRVHVRKATCDCGHRFETSKAT
jgi:hypothetical protein